MLLNSSSGIERWNPHFLLSDRCGFIGPSVTYWYFKGVFHTIKNWQIFWKFICRRSI